jgi:hypothetical protein
MASERRLKADGDTWTVRIGERAERPGYRTLIFFCTSTNQRPYRVVEVPKERLGDGGEDLTGLDEDTLADLYREARALGYPREYE